MKRFLRVLFQGVCALLFLASLTAWIHGHFRWVFMTTPTMHPQLQVNNYINHMEIGFVWYVPTVRPGWGAAGVDAHPEEAFTSLDRWQDQDHYAHEIIDGVDSSHEFLGILIRRGQRSCSGSEVPGDYSPWCSVLFPTWIPVAVFSIPLLLAAKSLLRRKPAAGLCPKCSYDLRAHTPGDKCPECGTVIGPQAARP